MRHLSKAWLFVVCALSYTCLGQAGCETTSQHDIVYIRSDIQRMKRDVEEIKQKLGTTGMPAQDQDILRNQAAQREMLLEIQEGQQRTESRLEETRYELSILRQEITNLKLNMINQMEALRAASKTGSAQQPPASSLPVTPPAESSTLKPPATIPGTPTIPEPSPAVAPWQPAAPSEPAAPPTPVIPATSTPPPVPSTPVEPIDYTKLYDTAYEDYVRQNYSLARNGFEEYLQRFPDTDLADNAQYWIGECYYAEGRYEEAAEAFNKVVTRYPSGNKVPRAMLKAGYSLQQLGRDDQARLMFQQVIDAYPLSSEADQAKSKLKQMR
ncbi:MAG: tol-pal system protein YbgF [Candidatus Abyssubacteria bacterium]